MDRLRSKLFFVLLVVVFGCATSDLPEVPTCPSLELSKPLPDASCDGPDVEEIVSGLAAKLEPAAGPLIVRVEFDEEARPNGVCMVRHHASGEARYIRPVREAAATLDSAGAGPACLASRRIDFNRRAAALAEMRRVLDRCAGSARATVSTLSGRVGDIGQVAGRQYERCVESEVNWIVIDSPDAGELLFVAPEIHPPPDLSARETAARCADLETLGEQVTCIRGEGWELLPAAP